jgi:hypothetical protein
MAQAMGSPIADPYGNIHQPAVLALYQPDGILYDLLLDILLHDFTPSAEDGIQAPNNCFCRYADSYHPQRCRGIGNQGQLPWKDLRKKGYKRHSADQISKYRQRMHRRGGNEPTNTDGTKSHTDSPQRYGSGPRPIHEPDLFAGKPRVYDQACNSQRKNGNQNSQHTGYILLCFLHKATFPSNSNNVRNIVRMEV